MNKVKQIIKNNIYISKIYICFMTALYWILDHIYFNKQKKIMFVSFSGRQYSDSPREIYLKMKQDDYFKDYKFVWAMDNPDKFSSIEDNVININSFKYLKELMSSSIWISNASIERLIPYKSDKITYINTWHGIPLKYIGGDAQDVDYITKYWYDNMQADLMSACSPYDYQIFKSVFPKVKNIKMIGLPRNETLYGHVGQKEKKFDKKVILYAPTFRENSDNSNNMFFSRDFSDQFPDVIFLVRSHYFSDLNINNMIDVSDKDLNKIMEVVDLVITDYSSLMFDYSILEKPLVLYPYDLREYEHSRGMYMDISQLPFTKIEDVKSLKEYLECFNQIYPQEVTKAQKVKEMYQNNTHNSTDYIIRFLKESRV